MILNTTKFILNYCHYHFKYRNYIIKKLNNFQKLKNLISLLSLLIIYFSYHYLFSLDNIHIAMSLNNNYTYPLMVSISSILINSNKNTFIHFHILIGNDVERINKHKILSLKNLNKNSFFNFYNVRNQFKGWKHGKQKLTVASFYRMILGKLIKNINKIIYLDGDTLTYNDLNEMYNLNISNLYFKGIHEIVKKNFEIGMDKSKYICAGVMLMNLELIRTDDVFSKFKDYYCKYYNKGIYYGDQHIINDLFKDKIGFLPPKYGMWFIDKNDIENYKKLNPIIYTEKELEESINKPVIRHIWGKTKEGFLIDKPWLINKYYKIKEDWNFYAKKTGYYSSICIFFKNACINIDKKK